MKNTIKDLKENVISKVNQIQGTSNKMKKYKTLAMHFEQENEELDKQLKEKEYESKNLQSIIERQRKDLKIQLEKSKQIKYTISEITENAVNFKRQHASAVQQIRSMMSGLSSWDSKACQDIAKSLRFFHINVVKQIDNLQINLKSQILGLEGNVLEFLKTKISNHCQHSLNLLKELESEWQKSVQDIVKKNPSCLKKADKMLKTLVDEQGKYTDMFEKDLNEFGFIAKKTKEANNEHIEKINKKNRSLVEGVQKKLLEDLVSLVTTKMNYIREELNVPKNEEPYQKQQEAIKKHVQKMNTFHTAYTTKHDDLIQMASLSLEPLTKLPTDPSTMKNTKSYTAIEKKLQNLPDICNASSETEKLAVATLESLSGEANKIKISLQTKGEDNVSKLENLQNKLRRTRNSYTEVDKELNAMENASGLLLEEIDKELNAMENVSGLLLEVVESGNGKITPEVEEEKLVEIEEVDEEFKGSMHPPKHFASYSGERSPSPFTENIK